jgi:hypothetical protein
MTVAGVDDVSQRVTTAKERAATPRNRWFLGSVKRNKVIHREYCRHARVLYNWAAEYPTAEALAVELVNSRAASWHRACETCCPDLAAALRAFSNGALA